MQNLVELIELSREGKRPVRVGEVGCATGRASKVMAEHLSKTGGELFIIDWFQGSKVDDRYVVPPGLKDKFLEYMNGQKYTLVEMESGAASDTFLDGFFDLLWIDADHRYHAIKRDIDLWLPKVRKGGILAGHDYDAPEFKEEFIEQDYVEGIHHGVTKAVNERFGIPNRIGQNWWIRI